MGSKFDHVIEYSLQPEWSEDAKRAYSNVEGWGTIPISESDVEDVLKGSFDIHIHSHPDPLIDTGWDQLDVACRACDEGMGGVCFKSQTLPTANTAPLVQKAVDEYAKANGKERVLVFGGVVLNHYVGGINPKVVEMSARAGGKIVWMPSHDAAHHRRVLGETGGVEVITPEGEVLPAVKTVMELCLEYDMIFDTCHTGTREKYILVDEAKKMGINKILVNHPNWNITRTSIDQMVELSEMGGYMGLYMYGSVPGFNNNKVDPMEMFEIIKRVGPGMTVLATDLGTAANVHPVQGLRLYIRLLLMGGVPKADIEKMTKTNPRYLLGLD